MKATSVILRKKKGPKPKWAKELEARTEVVKTKVAYYAEQLIYSLTAYVELTAHDAAREYLRPLEELRKAFAERGKK